MSTPTQAAFDIFSPLAYYIESFVSYRMGSMCGIDVSINFLRLAYYYNPCTCNGEYVRTGGDERQHCSYTSHVGTLAINTDIIALASYTYHIHNHNHIISVGIRTPNLNTRTDSPPLDYNVTPWIKNPLAICIPRP